MTDAQYFFCVVGVLVGIGVTAGALWRQTAPRLLAWWRWRQITRRARPDPWPYDWAADPEFQRRPRFPLSHVRKIR